MQAFYESVHDVPSYLHEALCAAQLIKFGAVTVLLHNLTWQVVEFTSSYQHFSDDVVMATLHGATLKAVYEVQEPCLFTHLVPSNIHDVE